MHTGDKLTGSVCKCMRCAKQRGERQLRWAERNMPVVWQATRALEFEAEELEREAEQKRADARERYRSMVDRAQEALTAEEPSG